MGNNITQLINPEIANVSNEQILQNEISLGRWLLEAILLLFSLGESYDLQKRILIKQLGFSYIPDIYLEKGCKALQIKGRTIIELKYNLLFDTENRQNEIYRYLKDGGFVDNLLVLYINSNDFDITGSKQLGRVDFIKAEKFVEKVKNAIKKGKGDVNKILKKKSPKKRSWQTIRDDRLTNAINDYNRYNSVLFLGAGVSSSAHVANWNDLLKDLLGNGSIITSIDYNTIYKELDFSNIVTARYIQKVLNIDNANLVNRVRKILYSHANTSESDLISVICDIIRNQEKVRSVITYNYDTLLEDNLKRLGKRCFSLYRNNRDESSSFPVYHVHGIIYNNEKERSQVEEIVLCERDYHRVYSEVFDWSNVEQLHALTRCTCFFIGLSMKDPNLRRLLEIAKKGSEKSVRHYVFLERKSKCKTKEKRDKDFQTREDILADLGLNVIWYGSTGNHRMLPVLLKKFIKKDE